MERQEETSKIEELTERLYREGNEAIEELYAFMTEAPEGEPISKEGIAHAFVLASFLLDSNPDTAQLSASDILTLEAETKRTERERSQSGALSFLQETLSPHCSSPELGKRLELCFSQYIETNLWGYSPATQPATPPKETTGKEPYSPMVHGKATDDMASMAGRPLTKNTLNDTASIESGGTKLVVSHLAGTLGVSTHQLLSKAMTEFTKLNHTGEKKREVRELGVSFPLKEYAFRRGYDVYEHPTTTEEEREAEKKRAKMELDNARRQAKRDLEILFNSRISWSETVKGKEEAFLDIHPIGAKGIKNSYVYMSFTKEMGDYLIQLPITQYPDALYKIDGNHVSAYAVGCKLCEHFNMDSNQKRGTAQLIRVKHLLEETKLPPYESFRKTRESWTNKIKEPFEDIMEYLVQMGVLEDWRYSHSKGGELTDEEATTFSSYEDWADTLIFFTLKDAPDHTARLEAKEERKKEEVNASKKKKGNSTKKQ